MTPPPPLRAIPNQRLPARVRHGATELTCRLVGGDGGDVYLPPGSTAAFQAVENLPEPTAHRRARRVIAGPAFLPAIGYEASYNFLPADLAHSGHYTACFVVTYPTGQAMTYRAGKLEIIAMGNLADSADQTITGGAAAALATLPCGPTGYIVVTAHPGNGNTIIRVGVMSDVAVDHGQPLGAGASYPFFVQNANVLGAIVESGSGKLCVSAA